MTDSVFLNLLLFFLTLIGSIGPASMAIGWLQPRLGDIDGEELRGNNATGSANNDRHATNGAFSPP